MAVFLDGKFAFVEAGRPVEETVYKLEAGLERSCAGALVVYRLEGISKYLLQGLADAVLGPEHAHAVRLEDADSVVPVYDEPGKAVSFSVYEAEAIGAGRRQTDGEALVTGARDSVCPERRRLGVCGKAEYAYGDGSYLVVAAGEVVALGIMHGHKVSLAGRTLNLGDGAGEDPRMEPSQRLIPALLEYQLYHRFASFSCGGACGAWTILSSAARVRPLCGPGQPPAPCGPEGGASLPA